MKFVWYQGLMGLVSPIRWRRKVSYPEQYQPVKYDTLSMKLLQTYHTSFLECLVNKKGIFV